PIRPRPSPAVGNPFVSCRQLLPPSGDTNRPLPVPSYALLYSHGPCRAAHRTAYTICGFAGSSATSIAPVFSSLYKTLSKVRPPSVDRNTPRSWLGPYG